MGKRKHKAKRSLASLPKGLAVRNSDGKMNPFETTARQKRPKYEVHNRKLPTNRKQPSALAKEVERRQNALKAALLKNKKSNVFDDQRIGEYNRQMTEPERKLQRLVKERSRQSKRSTKFSLSEETILTHKGQSINELDPRSHVMLSDDDEDDGNLDAADTTMHFGGGQGPSEAEYYGGKANNDLTSMYSSRKTELDDLILRRKILKAEKMKSREDQVEAFENMDESFAELSKMLSFRDKEAEIRKHIQQKRAGELEKDDQEMEDWDKEMKRYLFVERKVKATDRTKTPEEIAKEEADRLHELETRRLARMNGDFEGDDFSDLSDTETQRKKPRNPDVLDDSEDETEKSKTQTHFTADGLVEIDSTGKILGPVGRKKDAVDEIVFSIGDKVEACYHAEEQYEETWYPGTISAVNKGKYDVEYDDGDYEEGILPKHVRHLLKSKEQGETEKQKKDEEAELRRKQSKAKSKAREEMPYVFEIPTTLEVLNDVIAAHASTGKEASLVISRIYTSNSVRLDRRNAESMQNFYDVLIRRLIAVGDAIHEGGNGGDEIGRFAQLDSLTQVLYNMSQDSPEMAATVWGRRLGILSNAHGKRLRDAEFEQDEDFTAWPLTGTFCALRVIGHVFPVTDLRHVVVTPTLLFLGQMITQTPMYSCRDLSMAVLYASLLVEYTKEAKRIAPEALALVADIIRLCSKDKEKRTQGPFMLPNVALAASHHALGDFAKLSPNTQSKLSLVRQRMSPTGIINMALHLAEVIVDAISMEEAERELLEEIVSRLLEWSNPPRHFQERIVAVVERFNSKGARVPLQRRPKVKFELKTLAPRMENPEHYSLSKDKGKSATQAALDRTRREYRREHKAVSRELRLDSAYIERARREEHDRVQGARKTKRQQAFAWLEGEQAAMNQQVRMGGGLLKGGGMGAAKAKAASGKLGMRKGKLKK